MSDLIAGHTTDPDFGQTEGIAVTGVINTNGTWEYSTDSGGNWTAIGLVNTTSALLLKGDATTFVRFRPNSTFSGTVTGGITFRAWDGFTGAAATKVNPGAGGSATAFSTASASSSIFINDAPSLSGTNDLAHIAENQTNSAGTLVSALISSHESDVNNNSLGIAVTAVDNTNGTWQYTTNSGTTWTDFGAVSGTSALLLAANAATRVRFVPNSNFVGSASITFQGWDQTSGTAGGTADATVDGGTTAFSTASATASIVVEAPPTITGTASIVTNDLTPALPFAGVIIGDPNLPAETFTVTITESTTTHGALSNLGGFTNVGGGVYRFTGSAAAATLAINAIIFTPRLHEVTPGHVVVTSFRIDVSDLIVSATDANSIVTVTARNTAPTLSGANDLTKIQQNPATNNGDLVSALIAGQVTDPDLGQTEGIAITAVDNTNGSWQYSTDGGGSWSTITGVSDTQALLLTGDANTRVRFMPNAGFSGLQSNGLTFRAWDGSTGAAGGSADTSTNGNATAFSSAHASSSIFVNDAPVLAGANDLTTIVENPGVSNTGTSVSALIAGQGSDVNGNPLGIAVTAVDNTHGAWQYSVDGGANWTAFGSPTGTTARLFTADALTRVRFVPNSNFFGLVSAGLTFQAWDLTTGVAGGTANATVKGGTTAFSVASFSAAIRVNAPPTITGTVAGQATGDNVAISPFSAVTVGDPNSPQETLTVTVVVGTPANGQFTVASLTGWTTVVAGSTYQFTGTAALTTAALRALSFTPTIHQVVVGSSVTTGFAIGVNNGINVTVSDTATTVVATAINDAPLLDPTLGQSLNTITEKDVANAGNTILSLAGAAISDVDFGPVKGIAITGTSLTGAGLGVWQYSIDNGATWTSISGVSSTSALLLRATDRVALFTRREKWQYRYDHVPRVGRDLGNRGALANTAGGGGTTAFSTAIGTATITATDVNDAPVLTAQNYTLPVSADNGAVLGAMPAVSVDLPQAPFAWAIVSGNANGAFTIDSATGAISVSNNAVLTYSPTPIVLTISATENQFTSSPAATSTQTISIQTWQIALSATQVDSASSSRLTIHIDFPVPTQAFSLTINWNDGTGQPIQTITVSPGATGSITLPPHFFAANPDKVNPAAPIPIDVAAQIVGPSGAPSGVVGKVRTTAAVPGTGLPGISPVQNNTSSAIIFTSAAISEPAPQNAAPEAQVAEGGDTGVAGGEATTTNVRRVLLRIVDPSGNESQGADITVPDQALDDLPSLLRKLPDGHYRIYLSEGGKERIVIDVVVRQGRAVDPTDDSGGTQDRPPTSSTETGHRDPIVINGGVTPAAAVAGVAESTGAENIATALPLTVSPPGVQHADVPVVVTRANLNLPLSSRKGTSDWRRRVAPPTGKRRRDCSEVWTVARTASRRSDGAARPRSLGKGGRLARRLRKSKRISE